MKCASEHKFLAHHSIAVRTKNNKGKQDKNMPANIIAWGCPFWGGGV